MSMTSGQWPAQTDLKATLSADNSMWLYFTNKRTLKLSGKIVQMCWLIWTFTVHINHITQYAKSRSNMQILSSHLGIDIRWALASISLILNLKNLNEHLEVVTGDTFYVQFA